MKARSRFHDTAVDAVAKDLRLAGLRVATEVGVRGGRVDLVVLNADGAWSWMFEVKVSSAGLLTAPAQLRGYADVSEREVRATTLLVPSGTVSPALERQAERSGVDLWSCDFRTLVGRMEMSARPPAWTYVSLPAIHAEVLERMSRDAVRWYAENQKAAA